MISLIKYLLLFIFGVILYLSNIQINKFTIGNPSKDSPDRNKTWYFYEYNGKIYCDEISNRTEWFPPQQYHIQPPQNNQMGQTWQPTLTVTGNNYFDSYTTETITYYQPDSDEALPGFLDSLDDLPMFFGGGVGEEGGGGGGGSPDQNVVITARIAPEGLLKRKCSASDNDTCDLKKKKEDDSSVEVQSAIEQSLESLNVDDEGIEPGLSSIQNEIITIFKSIVCPNLMNLNLNERGNIGELSYEKISSGFNNTGDVYKLTYKGTSIVVKCIDIQKLGFMDDETHETPEEKIERLQNKSNNAKSEVAIMKILKDNPNTINYLGHVHLNNSGTNEHAYTFLFMDYFEGTTLFDHLNFGHYQLGESGRSPLNATQRELLSDIKSMVQNIHLFGVAHGDLNWENILINTLTGEIKIIDFDTSRCFLEGGALSHELVQLFNSCKAEDLNTFNALKANDLEHFP
jgi:serine/threonine protein kinase